MKMSRFLKKKTAYFIIGISLACLILGPLLGIFLDKMTVYEGKSEVIQEDSTTSIRDAFAYPVTLSKDQKLIIEIAEFYQNSSVTIRIIAKSVYDREFSLDNPPPSGLQFVYSNFGWVDEPDDSTFVASSLSLPGNGNYFYI